MDVVKNVEVSNESVDELCESKKTPEVTLGKPDRFCLAKDLCNEVNSYVAIAIVL